MTDGWEEGVRVKASCVREARETEDMGCVSARGKQCRVLGGGPHGGRLGEGCTLELRIRWHFVHRHIAFSLCLITDISRFLDK